MWHAGSDIERFDGYFSINGSILWVGVYLGLVELAVVVVTLLKLMVGDVTVDKGVFI